MEAALSEHPHPEPVLRILDALLTRRAPDAWARLQALDFGAAYAGTGRRCPGPAPFTVEETEVLMRAGVAAPNTWTLADAARTALLLRRLADHPAETHPSVLRHLYRTGDAGERIALLRALPLLPMPERFADIAIEACRTHVQDVFEALACDNAYPAACLADAPFNQMVLKALFTGVPLARIHGLGQRRNADLARMAAAYASERRAAGRPVPDDLALALEDAAP